MNQRQRPSWRALAGLSVFGVVLALALLELTARLLPPSEQFAPRMTAFRDAVLQPDSLLGWRPKPLTQTTIGGIVYRFDAAGCRGATQPDARPTLLIAGDSMALGWGVAEEDTFAARLARARPDLQVRNAGVVGYNLAQSIRRVAGLLATQRPVQVLLTYYPNDAEAQGGDNSDFLAHSAFARLALPALRAWTARAGLADDVTHYHARLHAPGSLGWQRVTDGLAQFAALCQKTKVKCTLVLVPELQQQPYGLVDVHARVAELARANGLGVVDLAPSIADVPPRTLWVMPDDAHPNVEAHRRFAAALLPGI
jgi:lysophospholipase L1-like esterase